MTNAVMKPNTCFRVPHSMSVVTGVSNTVWRSNTLLLLFASSMECNSCGGTWGSASVSKPGIWARCLCAGDRLHRKS